MKTDSFLFRFGRALKPGRCFSCCLLLLLACLSAHAQLDTDGDGLSNDDEAAIYFTNPALADTDGDGMPDGLETQLGTDPRNPNSVFRMLAPLTMSGGVRRFCWTSQNGQSYQLQNADPRTNGPGGGLVWRPIITVPASGTNTCVEVHDDNASLARAASMSALGGNCCGRGPFTGIDFFTGGAVGVGFCTGARFAGLADTATALNTTSGWLS